MRGLLAEQFPCFRTSGNMSTQQTDARATVETALNQTETSQSLTRMFEPVPMLLSIGIVPHDRRPSAVQGVEKKVRLPFAL